MTEPASLPSVLLVGHGRMGGAMLAGWTRDGLAPSAVVTNRSGLPAGSPHRRYADPDEIPVDFAPSLVVLAVKPQVAPAVMPRLAARFGRLPILSLMAGLRIDTIARAVGGSPDQVARAMPNTPAAIGEGVTGAFAPDAMASRRPGLDRLLRAVGAVVWVEAEDQLDIVTALSGSGPAYVFLLTELMERAGVRLGLDPATARSLARRTVSGSGALLAADDTDADLLRRAVTSPGGTTERALAVLMADDSWPRSVSAAIGAASARSRELAS